MARLVIWNPALSDEYAALFHTCVVNRDKIPFIDTVVGNLAKGRKRYEEIAKQIHCPWWMVGIIHYIECGFRFDRHLHNGDPLSARTIRVPEGRPVGGKPPFTFEQSAIDALRMKRFQEVPEWSIAKVLFVLEGYNGYGYRQYHPLVLSPYLWSFTNHYTIGKYTADGHFDPNCISQQAGLAGVLKRAVEKGIITLALFFLLCVPTSHAQDNIDSQPVKKPGRVERVYDHCHQWADDHPKKWGAVKFFAKATTWAISTAGAWAQATQKKSL